MSDNIEQQDQIFFYNATNELINRTNNENRRINIPNYESSEFIMPIYELIDSRPITSSNNIIINNINNNMDTIRNYVNPLYDFPIPIMSYGGTAMLTSMIALGLVTSAKIHKDQNIY